MNQTDKKKQSTALGRRLYGSLPSLFLVFLIVLVISLFIQVGKEKDRLAEEKRNMVRKERPPVNVIVQDMVPKTVRERINLPGILEPWVDLNLLAEVRGVVVDVPVNEGDRVAQGEILVLLDSRDYENALLAIEASYNLALLDKKRLSGLYEQGIIARSELDNLEARVKNLAAEKAVAALQVERCRIAAPIAGIVNDLPVEKGRYLSVGDPVARVLDIDRLKVTVGIPESDAGAVRDLSSFEVRVDAVDTTYTAAKIFLSVASESMAQLYRLELVLENRAAELLPGMFARVEIVKQQVQDALAVPLYAVISREGKNFVFTEENGLVRRQEIELGILEGWMMQVTKGLSPGQRVIIVGQRDVDDGQQVKVIRSVTDPAEIVR